MNEIKKQVNAFLAKYGMHHNNINIDKEIVTFIREMERGLAGESSSLKMLCTYQSPEGDIPLMKPVITIDAGGTNLRVAVVYFDNNKQPMIEEFKSYPMPGSNGEISGDEFFNRIFEYLEPVIDKSDRIGFCFSYPTEMLPNGDGKLIKFTKEVSVRDMKDVEIGSCLIKTINARLNMQPKKIVLLNDTVATLLGGKAAVHGRRFKSYIGLILGTGTNTCYIEENRNILKAPTLPSEGSTIINIESGGYNKATRGIIDEKFDRLTADPGHQQFEKMISGAYQGSLLHEIIKTAIEEGLFTSQFEEMMKSVTSISSWEINDFCLHPYSEKNVLSKAVNNKVPGDDSDRLVLYYLIDSFFERAAKLITINLASIMIKTGTGKNPCLPVCVAAEGTAFYDSKLFKGKLEYFVKKHLNDKLGIYCEFFRTEDATLVGTAFAGLLDKDI
jgi:hexokinase